MISLRISILWCIEIYISNALELHINNRCLSRFPWYLARILFYQSDIASISFLVNGFRLSESGRDTISCKAFINCVNKVLFFIVIYWNAQRIWIRKAHFLGKGATKETHSKYLWKQTTTSIISAYNCNNGFGFDIIKWMQRRCLPDIVFLSVQPISIVKTYSLSM